MNGDKSQLVRALDVWVLGPFMILAGLNTRNLYFRVGFLALGYATIVYNARNYARNTPTAPVMTFLGSFPLPDV